MSDNLAPEERDRKIIHCMEVIEDCQRDMASTRSRFITTMILALIAVTVSIYSTFKYPSNFLFIILDVITLTLTGIVIITKRNQLSFLQIQKEAHEKLITELQQAR